MSSQLKCQLLKPLCEVLIINRRLAGSFNHWICVKIFYNKLPTIYNTNINE